MVYDVSGTASTVYGIAGMGIGLGVLAGTSSMVMRSMRGMYDEGYERRPDERPYYGRESPRPKSKKKSAKRKRDEYEEERPRDYYSPYGKPMRLNIPRYW